MPQHTATAAATEHGIQNNMSVQQPPLRQSTALASTNAFAFKFNPALPIEQRAPEATGVHQPAPQAPGVGWLRASCQDAELAAKLRFHDAGQIGQDMIAGEAAVGAANEATEWDSSSSDHQLPAPEEPNSICGACSGREGCGRCNWKRKMLVSAEKRTMDAGNKPPAASASGSVTEQPTPAPTLEPAMPACLELETVEIRPQEYELSYSDTEPALLPAAAAAAAATEHSDSLDSSSLPTEKKWIYAIVNAFFNNKTLYDPQAEALVVAALNDERCFPPSVHSHLYDIFSLVFFTYPLLAQGDRTVFKPRDTLQYIRQWYTLASMREKVIQRVTATEHDIELSKTEVKQIESKYMEDMKAEGNPKQRGKSWVYWHSCVQAKMRREAGHALIANAIWEIGLPRMPQFATDQAPSSATEQREDARLSTQDLENLPWAIRNVLEWLDRVAVALLDHKNSAEHLEAVRKSGHKNVSGLSDTEKEARKAKRKAQLDMRIGGSLSKECVVMQDYHPWQVKLIEDYRSGLLLKNLNAAKQLSLADTKCIMPSLARGSVAELLRDPLSFCCDPLPTVLLQSSPSTERQ